MSFLGKIVSFEGSLEIMVDIKIVNNKSSLVGFDIGCLVFDFLLMLESGAF